MILLHPECCRQRQKQLQSEVISTLRSASTHQLYDLYVSLESHDVFDIIFAVKSDRAIGA